MNTVKVKTPSAAALAAALVLAVLPTPSAAASAAPVAVPAAVPAARGADAAVAELTSPIGRHWLADVARWGAPVTGERCTAGGACVQQFEHGTITWHPSFGLGEVPHGDVERVYRALGGPDGALGPVAGRLTGGLRGGGAWQRFADGAIVSLPGGGAHAVRGSFWSAWSRLGREDGALGYPLADERRDGGGTIVQRFENGTVYDVHGGVATRGDIDAAYRAAGGTASSLGPPVADEHEVPGGFTQDFERGRISWSPATGAHPVIAGMLSAWQPAGAEQSWLGFPLSDELEVPGGIVQLFQGGELYWSPTASHVVGVGHGGIRDHYHAFAGPFGPLGIATGDRTPVMDGYLQRFAGGAIVWGPATGARVVANRTLDAWLRDPAAYGWPVQDSVDDPARGTVDTFEHRQIIADAGLAWSAEPVDAGSAVVICDSQCAGDSWVEQGLRGAGYGQVVERTFPGAGYGFPAPALGVPVAQALEEDLFLLPQGSPGVVVLNLGGNDASQGVSDAVIVEQLRRLVDLVRGRYPSAAIVVDGVMSRSDAGHARRRAVDALIVRTAQELGVAAVSAAGWGSRYGAAYLDAVHLAQPGHDAIAPHYADALRSVLG